MLHEKIFKEDSKGKTRVWYIESEDGMYRVISGILGGNLVTTEWTKVLQKNIGKANETSLAEQTLLEVNALYKKKLEKDYHKKVSEISTKLFFAPMLASTYKEGSNVSGWYSQPKLNGMRCVINSGGAWTRQGKPINTVPHIIKELEQDFIDNPHLVLDGELYNHNMHDDFNTIMSICRQSKVSDEDLVLSEKNIQFHIYDVPAQLPFRERIPNVNSYAGRKYIEVVPTVLIKDENHLNELYADYLANNYEGQMIRSSSGYYENKRSKFLIKRKTFQDAEFPISSLVEGKGNWSGMIKVAMCVTKKGKSFGATIKGNQAYAKKLLTEKDDYINGTAKVKFFSTTPDGIPLFPVAIDLIKGERED